MTPKTKKGHRFITSKAGKGTPHAVILIFPNNSFEKYEERKIQQLSMKVGLSIMICQVLVY